MDDTPISSVGEFPPLVNSLSFSEWVKRFLVRYFGAENDIFRDS